MRFLPRAFQILSRWGTSSTARLKKFTYISGTVIALPSAGVAYYFLKERVQPLTIAAATTQLDSTKWMAGPVTEEASLLKDGSFCGQMERLCMDIQSLFCHFVESKESTKKMLVDKWYRKAGDGGGVSCILENGETFERAGVNISVIRTTLTPNIVQMMRSRQKSDRIAVGKPYFVCGVSCVLHPRNPHVPSMHFNFRYFEVDLGDGEKSWWFGGGTDLTPTYLEEEDARHFHQTLKDVCDKHDPKYYPKFKKWCDDYFRLPHRNESRGVGGIFFDDLDSPSQEKVYAFVRNAAMSVLPAFKPIVERRMHQAYTQADREWQLLRRGRYVEFNLVHDRGTKFGLCTKDARIESILMSLPVTANWKYAHDPSKDERQAKLTEVLRNPREWV